MRPWKFVAALSLGVGMLSAPAVAATTPTVTIVLASPTAVDDVLVVVSGRVATVPSGTEAELQRDVGDGWTRVRKVILGADGKYATNYRPIVGENLIRLYVPSTKKTSSVLSPPAQLTVVPAMSPSDPIATDAVTFTGHLPTQLARTVRLQVERPDGWATVATGRSTTAGVFSLRSVLGSSARVRVEAPQERIKDKTRARFVTPIREVTVFAGRVTSADPRIKGRLEVGASLAIESDSWGPGAVDLAYQWRRNGVGIGGATSSSYALVDADADARMSVTVTGGRAEYVSASRTSPETEPVQVPTCGSDQPRKASGEAWRCAFADEFDGDSLDRTKWLPQQTAVSGIKSGPGCIVDDEDNVFVADGSLHLSARREDQPFTCRNPNGDSTTEFTNGSVTSYGRFSQAFGRYEFRARFPDVSVAGLHGALWLYPIVERYGAWPQSGEIDVAEVYSRYPDRAIPFVHYKTADPNNLTVTNTGCKLNPAEFHTYLLEWTTSTIKISYDGNVCLNHTIAPAWPLAAPLPFGRPFAVILTQVQGGDGTNKFVPDSTPLPATMQVDYVRIWK